MSWRFHGREPNCDNPGVPYHRRNKGSDARQSVVRAGSKPRADERAYIS